MIDNQQNNSRMGNGAKENVFSIKRKPKTKGNTTRPIHHAQNQRRKEMVIRKWTKAAEGFIEMKGKEQNLYTLREKLTNTTKECMELFDFEKCHQDIPTPMTSVFIGLTSSLAIVDTLIFAGCDDEEPGLDTEREMVVNGALEATAPVQLDKLLARAAKLSDMLALTHKQIQEAR